MTQPAPPIPSDLPERIVRLLDGSLTDEEFSRLNQDLAANEAALAFYVEFVAAYVGLTELGRVVPMPADAGGESGVFDSEKLIEMLGLPPQPVDGSCGLHFEPEVSAEERKRRIESYARQQLDAFMEQQRKEVWTAPRPRPVYNLSTALSQAGVFVQGIGRFGARLVKVAAVLALCALIIGLVWVMVSSLRPVATVVETVDARWERPVKEQVGLRRQRLHLEQGYARIRLRQGAELIVQAPSTFQLQTPNKVFLEAGWVTARVPVEARGFMVRTPLSNVVDYGTEFGLLVNKESNAEVHVFDGRVGLQSRGGWGLDKPTKELLNGEAATIDRIGQVRQALTKDRTRLFVRTLPSADGFGFPGRRLDLSDMVGGGNGLGTGVQGQGLDPSTGEVMDIPMVLNGLAGGFRPVPSLLFIDGVFVPDGGMGPQAISSTGLAFDGFPDTVGVCRETITNGAVFHVRPFWPHRGVLPRRAVAEGPSLGLPASAGVTFDLKKIRSAMPDVRIERFHSMCGLSQTVSEYGRTNTEPVCARVWVLVDGVVRLDKTFTAPAGGTEEIDIPLQGDDRFLTLATTQVGDYSWGWVLFTEPALDLSL